MVEKGLAPARAELLRGVIVEKMPKSPLHTKITTRLWNALTAALGEGHWVRKEEPLTLKDSEPEPDLAVVPGSEADYKVHPSTALLVIEVSVTTVAEDRELAGLYAEAGVPEFWIVNAAARTIEVHRQPQGGRYTAQEIVAGGETLVSTALPAAEVDTAALFANLS